MNSRLIAARILCRVIKDGQSLTEAIEKSQIPGDSKDKAFIYALCFGVVRHYYRLEFILNLLLTKAITDIEIKVLALMGLFQLKYLRVKAHAAVTETVSATPQKKSWAKALLNGLLRNYLRQQDSLEQQAGQNEVANAEHPEWMVNLIKQDWPEQANTLFYENNQQAPMVLRVNLNKVSRVSYLADLAAGDIVASALPLCESAVLLEKPLAVENLPGFAEGWVSIQDSSPQLAAELLDVQEHQRVLDVCAAPGGKTAHLLEKQPKLKQLIAVDIDATRLLKVKENLHRLGLEDRVQLIQGDAALPAAWWDGQLFERILLDVPCSASGVIRRHPDIKLLRREQDIAALAQTQSDILAAIWPLLAPNGILLYATCSIFKSENELQIGQFLQNQKNAIELPIEKNLGIAREFGKQILTGQDSMDGFYYARLRKQ